MVEHIVASRQMAAAIQAANVTVDLPVMDVWGEPTSIQQTVGNLLDNALKFLTARRRRHIHWGRQRAGRIDPVGSGQWYWI